jgi:hypothetical protein
MTAIPHLTRARWFWLKALKQSRALQHRPFLASELKNKCDDRLERTATGATLTSLEKAGWVERTLWGKVGQGMPFQSGGLISAWQLTDLGRSAIAACPDTFPGEPVYGKKRV